MTDYERRVFGRAIDQFGHEAQQKMLVEEMSELTKEVCKMWRGRTNLDHLAEEIADVEICIEQLKLMLQNGGLVQQWRLEKTRRLEETMNEEILRAFAKEAEP